MRIAIIGASGMAGRDLYAEATKRGHEATAIVRDADRAAEVLGADATVLLRDAFGLTSTDLAGFDVVVNAFAIAPERATRHVELARHLVETARVMNPAPRLAFVLGAGSLTTGDDGHLHVEDIRAVPGSEAWVAIPEQQLRELEYLRTVEDVDWVGASPSSTFSAGPAAQPVIGGDTLLFASDGESHTTSGTYAVGLLDELEQPAHSRTRFTIGDE